METEVITNSKRHLRCAQVKLDLHFCITTDEKLISDIAKLAELLYQQIRDIWAGDRTSIEINL